MTRNPLFLEKGLYPLFCVLTSTHKYLLAREGGQIPCQNKHELKLGTLTMGTGHKVLMYVEYRAVSVVFQNIDPPPPLHPASVSSPLHQRWGVHTRRTVRGRGVNILEDARHWIGLLQYNLSTVQGVVASWVTYISVCAGTCTT
jgi:hypothetical protein